jgi:hypothetical protein
MKMLQQIAVSIAIVSAAAMTLILCPHAAAAQQTDPHTINPVKTFAIQSMTEFAAPTMDL